MEAGLLAPLSEFLLISQESQFVAAHSSKQKAQPETGWASRENCSSRQLIPRGSCMSFFGNVREQSNIPSPQNRFTNCALELGTVASFSAGKHVAFSVDHRPQRLQVFVVNEDWAWGFIASIRAESATQLLLQPLTLLTKLFDFGLGIRIHGRGLKLAISGKPKPVSRRNAGGTCLPSSCRLPVEAKTVIHQHTRLRREEKYRGIRLGMQVWLEILVFPAVAKCGRS